ncbi:MAG: EamA family transporter RarD [Planctomycetes bacterium]|nr:EamA family transporter RarD [Planctomycetota bacterium]
MTKISKSSAGVMFAVGSYLWWAIVTPLYFKLLIMVPIVELLVWRVLSGLPLLILLLVYRKKLMQCMRSLQDKRTSLLLLGSTFFISINWIVFVLAVVWNRLTESSLGYYINPLFSVALGFLLLGERISRLQWIAVAIAGCAVTFLAVAQGSLPWISITLAFSFGMYGLLRKTMEVESIEGLTVEMGLTFPVCLAVQVWFVAKGESLLPEASFWIIAGLLLGGFVTIMPLLLFASGARRLQLSTMGILQYIAPTGQLLLAIIFFNEPFGAIQIIVFALIWIAIILYSYDAYRSSTLSSEPLIE